MKLILNFNKWPAHERKEIFDQYKYHTIDAALESIITKVAKMHGFTNSDISYIDEEGGIPDNNTGHKYINFAWTIYVEVHNEDLEFILNLKYPDGCITPDGLV